MGKYKFCNHKVVQHIVSVLCDFARTWDKVFFISKSKDFPCEKSRIKERVQIREKYKLFEHVLKKQNSSLREEVKDINLCLNFVCFWKKKGK